MVRIGERAAVTIISLGSGFFRIGDAVLDQDLIGGLPLELGAPGVDGHVQLARHIDVGRELRLVAFEEGAFGFFAVLQRNHAGALVAVAVEGQQPIDIVGRLHAQTQAAGPAVGVAVGIGILDRVVAALVSVQDAIGRYVVRTVEDAVTVGIPVQVELIHALVDVTVGLVDHERTAQRDPVVDWHIEHAAHQLVVVVAEFNVAAAEGLISDRACGDDIDGTGGGVAAKQGALRSTQHFHALDVMHQCQTVLRTRRVAAVDVNANGGITEFGEIVGGDTAHHHLYAGIRGREPDLHVRHQISEIAHVLHTLAVEGVLGECGNRQGRLHQGGFEFGRGDRDLFQHLRRFLASSRRFGFGIVTGGSGFGGLLFLRMRLREHDRCKHQCCRQGGS